MYEIVAGKEDYNPFDGFTLKPEVKDRIKIYCSDYLGSDWGSTTAFKNRNWANGSYMLGISNHDSEIHKVLEDEARKRNQIDELARILKIPKEKLSTTEEFIKAKYAEIMRSEHNMFFFTDSLNLDGYYQKCKNDPNNYRKAGESRLKNWSLTDVYPPGSTFKAITVASAMDLFADAEIVGVK